MVWQTQIFVFLPFYPPNNPKNENFEKTGKNIWRYYHFTYVYHKSQSYNAWFLRYEAWQTEFFVILDCFMPFSPPNNKKKSKFWKNEKSTWRNYHFTHVYHKWQSYDVWFLRYRAWQTGSLDHFGSFFAL